MPTDEELTTISQAYASGDKAPWAELLIAQKNIFESAARRHIHNRDPNSIEDLAMNAIESLLQVKKIPDNHQQLVGLIYKAVYHSRDRKMTALYVDHGEVERTFASSANDLERYINYEYIQQILAHIRKAAKPKEWDCFEQRVLQELTEEQVAGNVNLSSGTVRYYVQRVQEKIAREIERTLGR